MDQSIQENKDAKKRARFKLLFPIILAIALFSLFSFCMMILFIINNIKVNRYRMLKDTNQTFSECVANTTAKSLITEEELNSIEKLISIGNFKSWLNCDNLPKKSDYSYQYKDLSVDFIRDVSNDYWDDINYRPNEYELTHKMRAILDAIEEYEDNDGRDLVERVVADILASKVIDNYGLDVEKVSEIKLIHEPGKRLKVSFSYSATGEKYVSEVFRNNDYDLAENIGKDLSNKQYRDVIEDLQVLLNDKGYQIKATVKQKK